MVGSINTKSPSIDKVIQQTNKDLKEASKLRKNTSYQNNKITNIYKDFYSNLEEVSRTFTYEEIKNIQKIHKKFKAFSKKNINTTTKELVKEAADFESKQLVPFNKIGSGAAKIVLTKKDVKKQDHVYYIPVSSIFNAKKRELQSEIKTMENINEIYLKKNQKLPQNLATSAKALKGEKRVGGKFTIKVERASSDGEKHLRKNLSTSERMSMSRDFVNGLEELHSTNHVYGDLKPENCLIYRDKENNKDILKIADFGKTVKVSPKNPVKLYSGNPRYMAPEGILSKKSDVWGAGLMLVRIFEEKYLNKEGNLFEEDHFKSKKSRGIEQYLVKSKNFHVADKGGLRSLKARIRAFLSSLKSPKTQKRTNEIQKYLTQLQKKLETDYDPKEVKKLIDLLSKMLAIDPSKRPSMAIVKQELNKVYFDTTEKK